MPRTSKQGKLSMKKNTISKSRGMNSFRLNKKSKTTRANMAKKTKFNIKEVRETLEHQRKVGEFALQEGNLEVYAASNKIIMTMLISLMARKTDASIALANEYSDKTGLEIPKLDLKNRVPTTESAVKSALNSYYKPSRGSIAVGWRW